MMGSEALVPDRQWHSEGPARSNESHLQLLPKSFSHGAIPAATGGDSQQSIDTTPSWSWPFDFHGNDLLGYNRVPTEDPRDAEQSRLSWDESLGPGETVSWRRKGQIVLASTVFQSITMLSIIANAICIGLETDMPNLYCWDRIEMAFLVIFTMELLFRILVVGPSGFFFFKPAEKTIRLPSTARRRPLHGDDEVALTVAWNWFDFSIVSIGVLSFAVDFFAEGPTPTSGDATLLRFLRLFRILRVLRVLRLVRFLKQLYLLVYGFMEGTVAVFWVSILASACIYVCSIVLVRAYGRPVEDDPHYEFFASHFGSIPRTMFTLFEIMASPNLGSYRDVIFDYPPLVWFLVVFVIFGSFGVSGLLAGVITESIIDKNQARIEEQRVARESKRKVMERESAELFEDLDVENKGTLTHDDIMGSVDHISALFSGAGVGFPQYDFANMFLAMDHDDSGTIDKSEFVHGILELCDEVRPLSIMELHSQVARSQIKLTRCDAKVDKLAMAVGMLADDGDKGAERMRMLSEEVEALPHKLLKSHRLDDAEAACTEVAASVDAVAKRTKEANAVSLSVEACEQTMRNMMTVAEELAGSAAAQARTLDGLVSQVCGLLQDRAAHSELEPVSCGAVPWLWRQRHDGPAPRLVDPMVESSGDFRCSRGRARSLEPAWRPGS